MSSDTLVQRLRKDVFYGDARMFNMDRHNPLHMEAADRIEALEAALRDIKNAVLQGGMTDIVAWQRLVIACQTTAKQALEGEQHVD